jgi:integrase
MAAFRKSLLQNVRRDDMQDFLESKAQDCSASIVRHLRWFLNAIFKLAVSDGMIGANPAPELRIPRHCRPGRQMRSLDEQEVETYLAALDLRERLITRFAIFEGMRLGEILALEWANIDGDKVVVGQRVYRRRFDSLKNGKIRDAALSPGTLALLDEWRRLCADCDGGFAFPSENAAMPISLDNLWR